MARRPSASVPQARCMVDRVTKNDMRYFAGDFFRAVGLARSGIALEKIPSEIRHGKGYRPVMAAIGLAHQHEREDEEALAQFFLGMAAAFHGLIRLNEANELEARLAPALGLADAAAHPAKPMKSSVQCLDVKTFELSDLAAVLDADGIDNFVDTEDRVLVAVFGSDVGPINLMAQAIAEASCAYFLFEIPMLVRKYRRPEMMLALARANHGLLLGSFELGLGNGELNYKVVLPIDDACLSPSQLRHCLGVALCAISIYMPAFRRIVFDDVSAEEAIKFVES